MDIQKLNEEIQQLLELSPEKKQWAVDTRQARYLAAQATADREKAKFEKTKRSKRNLEPKEKKEVISSLEYIADNVSFIGTDFSDVKEENGNFYIVISNVDLEDGHLTASAEEQLKELLEKMSEKYGCNYTYKINGTKVEIICEKPTIKKIEYKYITDEDMEYLQNEEVLNTIKYIIEHNVDELEILPTLLPAYILDRECGTNSIKFAYSPTDDIGISIYIDNEDAPSYNLAYKQSANVLYIHKYWDVKHDDYYGYYETLAELRKQNLVICETYLKLNYPKSLDECLQTIDYLIDVCKPLIDEFKIKLDNIKKEKKKQAKIKKRKKQDITFSDINITGLSPKERKVCETEFTNSGWLGNNFRKGNDVHMKKFSVTSNKGYNCYVWYNITRKEVGLVCFEDNGYGGFGDTVKGNFKDLLYKITDWFNADDGVAYEDDAAFLRSWPEMLKLIGTEQKYGLDNVSKFEKEDIKPLYITDEMIKKYLK